MKIKDYQTPEASVLMLATESSVCIAASGTERVVFSDNEYDNDDFIMYESSSGQGIYRYDHRTA